MLNELAPILLFFIVFKVKGIFWATATLMGALTLQIGWQYHASKIITPKDSFLLISVWVLGSATLIFHDQRFIMWKPTLVFATFAFVLLVNHIRQSPPLIEKLLGDNLQLNEKTWRNLNIAWCSFFFVLAIINTIVIQIYDIDTWVSFKLFGIMGLSLLFTFGQAIYIYSQMKE